VKFHGADDVKLARSCNVYHVPVILRSRGAAALAIARRAGHPVEEWINNKKNPRFQMERQAAAAAAVGRLVIWHAQTEKGYRGLKKIADKLELTNLYVVYDPN
jgi:hypothetical protein